MGPGASATLRSLEPTASSLRSFFGRISRLQNALRTLSRAFEAAKKPLGHPPGGGRSLENKGFPLVSLRFSHIARFAHRGLSERSPRPSRGHSGTSRGSPKGSRHSFGAPPGALGGLQDALPEPPGALLATPEASGTPQPCRTGSQSVPGAFQGLSEGLPELSWGLLKAFSGIFRAVLPKVAFEEAVKETSGALRSYLHRASMLE